MSAADPTNGDANASHPSSEQLTAFVLGRLDDNVSTVVERHLAACAACRDLLRTPADDSLVCLIRDAGDTPLPTSDVSLPISVASVRPLAGYDLLEPLGTGGMGVVWKARQQSLPRLVAVKRLRAAGPVSAEVMLRFRREAEAVARLQHPNIVQIHEVGEQDGEPFLVLEYVAGGSLAQKLADGPQPPGPAAAVIESLARAIHFAHEQGILHRDLKPGNVLLTADGTPKIADFGLAKLLHTQEASETKTGAILGTPSYMAPEQARGETSVGAAVDVYALGAVLYETLIGRPPFRGPSALDTLAQVRESDPVPPRTLQPQVPSDLQTICLKCLQKEPRRRYASADELADDLRRFANGEAIHACPVGWVERLVKWTRRRPSQALLAAFLILAAAAALAGAFWHDHRLRAEVARAEEAESRARQQYREARALSKSILGRLTDFKKTHLPRERELLGGVIEDALAFYHATLNNNASADPEVRADTAQILVQLGELQAFLGQSANSIDSFRKAAELYEQLAFEGPQRLDYLQKLAQCYNALGCSTPGEESLSWHTKALALRQELADYQPASPHSLSDLAHTYLNLGAHFQVEKQWDRVEESYEQAVALSKKVLAMNPKHVAGRTILADCYCNLGLIYHYTDPKSPQYKARRRRAEENLAEAETLLESLVAEAPGRMQSHFALASARHNRADLLLSMDRYDEAMKIYGHGIEAIEKVLQEEPSFQNARKASLNLHGSRAQAYEGRKRFTQAVKDWDRVIELAEGPSRQRYRLRRAVALARGGEHARATREAQSLIAEPDCTPNMRYNTACVLALGHAAALADAGLSATDRVKLAEACACRAITALEKLRVCLRIDLGRIIRA